MNKRLYTNKNMLGLKTLEGWQEKLGIEERTIKARVWQGNLEPTPFFEEDIKKTKV